MNRVPRIFLDAPLEAGGSACLEGPAHHHLAHVLRLRTGAQVCLFNGDGRNYPGCVHTISRHRTEVALEEATPGPPPSRLITSLAIGISRPRHFDLAIQKATELGVARIRPLSTARSPGHEATGTAKQRAHWRAVVVSACEQCGRAELPAIEPPLTPAELCAEPLPENHLGLVLAPGGGALDAALEAPEQVEMVVGPEGGLSDPELARLEEHGYRATSCGPRILRTETAPTAMLAIVQYLWGDWR